MQALEEMPTLARAVITCNYDGRKKHKTNIGDESFIGSNTSLIAPIKIGKGARIGASSALTKDVAPNMLVLTRPPLKKVKIKTKKPEKKTKKPEKKTKKPEKKTKTKSKK